MATFDDQSTVESLPAASIPSHGADDRSHSIAERRDVLYPNCLRR